MNHTLTSFISFTLDSFKKRKELLHLFYIQVFVAIILYYIVILSDILVKTFYKTSITNIINSAVSNFWGAFFFILTVIALLFTIAFVLFTIRLMIFYQTKDISVMIAIGGILEIIENFYLVQLLLMCLVSSAIGVIVAYVLILVIVFISEIIFPIRFSLVVPFPDYFLVIIFIFFFFSTYLISGRLIVTTVKKYHEDLVQDKIDFNEGKDDNILARLFIWGRKKADGFIDLTTRIARLNIMRHSFVFLISLIINLLYAFFLVSVLFGTVIISDTTTNISNNGIGGDNTAMIVNKNYASFFETAFQFDSQTNSTGINFQASLFNYRNLMSVLQSFNITNIDDRVIIPMNIYAQNPSQNFNPNETYNTPSGGDFGSLIKVTPYIVALHPSVSIPNWNYYGENPKNVTGDSIFVGEHFAFTTFKSPMNGQLYFESNPTTIFTIKSIVLDPLFKGDTIYMDIAKYFSLFKPNPSLRNVIFLKVPSKTIVNELNSAIQKVNPDLSVYSLNPVIAHNANFNTLISFFLLFVGIPLLAVYFILSDSYNKQIIEERKQQLNLIKVLGGNLEKFKSVILKEIDGFTIWGLVLGYIFAMYFIIDLTVPFPYITLYSILFSMAILIIPYYVSRRRRIGKIKEVYHSYVES